jgi:hypothetical protein
VRLRAECLYTLNNDIMQVTNDIPKPERDTRLYRRITFPNGLEALLISDPSLVRVRRKNQNNHIFQKKSRHRRQFAPATAAHHARCTLYTQRHTLDAAGSLLFAIFLARVFPPVPTARAQTCIGGEVTRREKGAAAGRFPASRPQLNKISYPPLSLSTLSLTLTEPLPRPHARSPLSKHLLPSLFVDARQAGIPTPDDKDAMDDDEGEDDEEEGEEGEDGDEGEGEDGEDGGAEDGPGAGMKLAACSVDFNVGFFSDRESGFEGISHFLEHMVFMGSEKYPGENHFSDWLSQHWGSENACTDSEQTTYYFECHPKHLKEGLDIFSGYFLNPLLKMDAVEREVTAVESEFERVVNSDPSRLEAIMGHVAQDSHPFRVFGWGNRTSLTESELWKQGKIRDALLDHWRKHYHAGRMSITLLGEQSLDELQTMVTDQFGDMRGDGEAKKDYAAVGLPYGEQLPLMVGLYKLNAVDP